MRYLILFLALLLLVGVSTAKTDVFGSEVVHGRYYFYDNADVDDSFSGNFAVQALYASFNLNHWLRVAGGFGVSHGAIGSDDNDDITQKFYFIGMALEPYVELSDSLTLSLPVLIGSGEYEFENLYQDNGGKDYRGEIYQSSFFCIDPHLDLMWKLNGITGLGIQAGYSFFIHKEDEFKGSPYVGIGLYFGIL
ncbi:hypothetical protein K8R78_08750 [bacterium]|nr:hypothetical protein [bacterium]